MALPALLAVGAGILGGAQWLMSRRDQRQTQATLGAMRDMVEADPEYAMRSGMLDVMRSAEREAGQGGFLNMTSQTTDNLYDIMQQRGRDYANLQMQQQQQANNTAYQRANAAVQEINQMTQAEGEQFAQFASAFDSVEEFAKMPAGSFSKTALMNQIGLVAKAVFPEEATTEGSIQALVESYTGVKAAIDELTTGAAGKGSKQLAQQLYQSLIPIARNRYRIYQEGTRQGRELADYYRSQGYDIAQQRLETYGVTPKWRDATYIEKLMGPQPGSAQRESAKDVIGGAAQGALDSMNATLRDLQRLGGRIIGD